MMTMTLDDIEERTEFGQRLTVDDIAWLIQRIKDLELTRNKADRCSCIFEEDGETILRWCDAHAIWRDRIKELEAELKKWATEYERWTIENVKLAPHAEVLARCIRDLETELALNASLLALQTDLAREAETRATKAERELAAKMGVLVEVEGEGK